MPNAAGASCRRDPGHPSWWASPARLFLFLAVPFGLALVVAVPPYQPADEHPHFFRARQIAHGGWVPVRRGNDLGGWQPASFDASARPFKELLYHTERKADLALMGDLLGQPQVPERVEFVDFRYTAQYAPSTYAPTAVILALADIFRPPPLVLLYLARLANLGAYVLLMYIALRVLPGQRWTVFLLGLMPTAMGLGASVTADVVTIGAAWLFTAVCWRLRVDSNLVLSCWQRVGLVALGLVLALAKFAYLPLLLLWLMIPTRSFGSKRARVGWTTGFFVVALLAYVVWGLTVLSLRVHPDPRVSTVGQIAFVLQHPVEFLLIEARTFQERHLAVLLQFVGCLGHLDTVVPNLHFLSYLFLLLFVGLTEYSPPQAWGWRQRLGAGLVFLAAFATVPFMLYVQVSPVGNPIVLYLGGRYFLPLAVLLAALASNRAVAVRRPCVIPGLCLGGATLSIISTVAVVLDRFYG